MEIVEKKVNAAFTCSPSILKEAKDNAWRERKNFSQVIEGLLIKYNKSKEKKQVA